jgi:hypothetical protein
MAGSEISQNRKKHMKSLVVVPDEAGRWFAGGHVRVQKVMMHCYARMLLTLGHIARSITSMQLPPILACTPYQMLLATKNNKLAPAPCRKRRNAPGHRSAIESRPQAPVEPEAGPRDDGKGDVEYRAGAGVQDDEGRDDPVSDPDADPSLPPREPKLHHRAYDHPSAMS